MPGFPTRGFPTKQAGLSPQQSYNYNRGNNEVPGWLQRQYNQLPRYQNQPGQTYDPWEASRLFQAQRGTGGEADHYRGILGTSAVTSSGRQKFFGAQPDIGTELGKQFSWLYGGRPLSDEEIKPLLGKPGYDPRMGTIGGMPSIGQGPQAGVGGGYQPLKGFGEQFPMQEVGPTPAAMKDVQALKQLPYDLMDQYRNIANQGLYGVAGMNQIVQAGIAPAIERTKKMTGEALNQVRATRMQTVNRGARMLADKLGGQFASQPGLAMKLMGDQIIAPTLAKEMEAAIDLKVNETNMLNALEGSIGDLIKENQQSKAMGLAGVQDIMGFLQKRTADRWWDLSMENKFGWSPERTSAARLTASKELQRMQQDYNLDAMSLQAKWQDWLNERTYEREEYGLPGRGGSGGQGGPGGPFFNPPGGGF